MYPKVLAKMRESVRHNRIILTIHAVDEMDADDLLKQDVDACIMSGHIVARQWDVEFHEYKYVVEGEGLSSEKLQVIAKLRTDKTIIVTAYAL
jgi:hypothetical protein